MNEQRPADGQIIVAYVMTHYPRHAQTFLYNEVTAVASPQLTIIPMALNRPGDEDLTSLADQQEAERTVYIKGTSTWAILGALWRCIAAGPSRFIRTLCHALRLGPRDPRSLLWSVFHMVEAVLVADQAADRGCRHLHAQFGGVTATVALLASRLHGDLSWSFTVHGYHEFTEEKNIALEAKVADATFVVGISDHTRSQLMRVAAPEHWPKIRTVRCGIDVDTLPFRVRPVSEDGIRIVTVGRLSAEKGQVVLVDALAELVRRGLGDALRLSFVGDGPNRASLEQRVAELGLGDLVHFAGAVPASAVRAWLEEADIFCLPSFAEGIPVSIMEAFAIGVPVVASAVGGIPELVVDGVTGRLVMPGRPTVLADAIETLLDDVERSTMAAAARSLVEQRHDLGDVSQEMRDLLIAT
ncbi:MAG: colanic acid/amylovoran biosynthesis glycosyltransferase [Acidimicrobiales bacterium]|jgi:colanic acid/amylovoran biosynthesis glycosyltransferase